jgi:hypothetical protein
LSKDDSLFHPSYQNKTQFMKRVFSLMTLALSLLTASVLFSFSALKGGDTLEIYAGGKQLLQQFYHGDNVVKTLQLTQPSANEKIEVYYSHCGVSGKSRVLTIKDNKDNLLKELKFADVKAQRDPMSFSLKDVQKKEVSSLRLYYTSKEIPGGKLLAVLNL